MKLKIASNISGMEKAARYGIEIEHVIYRSNSKGILAGLMCAWKYRNYDYVIINGSGIDLFILALFKAIYPMQRVKIISLDLLLPQPLLFGDAIKCLVRRLLLARVHSFILYYKNTKGIEYYYNIPREKFRYIPFKINNSEKVLNCETKDAGYVFCGGKTRRDFDTLIEAVRGLNIPLRIVTMDNAAIAEHGSFLDESNMPDNVEVIKLDGSFEPFIKQMAEAKLVVLPLKPHICGTGIGVYIMAMALKKCVIISDGVSVDGVLDDGMAIIVPPCDPIALRKAVEKAYHDDKYRNKYEENGYRYAISLGGEECLNESIMKIIINDYINSKKDNRTVAYI